MDTITIFSSSSSFLLLLLMLLLLALVWAIFFLFWQTNESSSLAQNDTRCRENSVLMMRKSTSKRSEPFWGRMVVKKLLNFQENGDDFSADEDEQHGEPKRRYSDSGLSWSRITNVRNIRLFVGTWNVAGKQPPAENLDLKDWLSTGRGADIYVLGFQEVVPLNAGNVLGVEDEGPATNWEALIRQTLNGEERSTTSAPTSPWRENDYENSTISESEDEPYSPTTRHRKVQSTSGLNQSENGRNLYVRIISKQMVGIFITVWIRKDLRSAVQDVKVSCVGCGLMGYYGNKGSVAVSLLLEKTSFCFICTHLTSGEKEGDEIRRNSDVIEILRRTTFRRSPPGDDSPEGVFDHDRIIWLGDLNYRLSLSHAGTRALIDSEDWEALLTKDQLKVEQNVGGVFYGWHEGDIFFAPTYKYKNDSDEYSGDNSGEKRRTPAWCDRVLWYGNGLRQIEYLRTESKFSDHRPVSAMFLAEIYIRRKIGNWRTAAADDLDML